MSGGVLGAYIGTGAESKDLLTAILMTAPASLFLAKILIPETGTPETLGQVHGGDLPPDANVLDAAARGTREGLELALNVAAMLISFLALIALVNKGLGLVGDAFHYEGLTLQMILGKALAPLAWLLGVPWKDCQAVGGLLGSRAVLNELIAYGQLGDSARPAPAEIVLDRDDCPVRVRQHQLDRHSARRHRGVDPQAAGGPGPSGGACPAGGDPGEFPVRFHCGSAHPMIPNIFEQAQDAAVVIGQRVGTFPRVAIVLGSGLGAFADGLTEPIRIPYGAIPHFLEPTIAGHHGNLIVGRCGNVPVAVLQGRFHYYEGHDLETVTFPVRVLQVLGVTTLILTAATGGIRPSLRPGDILCLSDHLNLLGANPLRGPNDDRLGTRFPDMSEVYSERLRELAIEEARQLEFTLPTGVYAAMPGPSYETPAEIRMLRTLGADVVGMSTVPEAITARHAGMDVLALAIVSNWAAGITTEPITHDEVIEAGRAVGPRLSELLTRVVQRLGQEGPGD